MDPGWVRVGQKVDAERVRRGHRSLAGFAQAVGVGKSTIDNDTDPDLTALIDVWPKLSPGSKRILRLLAEDAARADRRS